MQPADMPRYLNPPIMADNYIICECPVMLVCYQWLSCHRQLTPNLTVAKQLLQAGDNYQDLVVVDLEF